MSTSVHAKSLPSCLTLCNPMVWSPPVSSAYAILQARLLEWVGLPSSRESSQPRDWIWVSYISCFGRQVLYHGSHLGSPVQFSSVAQSCPTLCDPMGWSTPDFPIHHQLLEIAQTPVHRVGDAIQPSHPLSSPSPLAFSLSQRQGLFRWVISSYPVAKVLEFQHQSLRWIFRTDFF